MDFQYLFSIIHESPLWTIHASPARLKELRESKGLTQQQLADAAGVKLGGIRDLEQAKNNPTWTTVTLALAAALGVDCAAFTTAPADRPAAGRGRPRKAEPPAEAASVDQDVTKGVEAKDGPAAKSKGRKGKRQK